ncbi:MAG TPA: DUF4340 domain-containing protein, partial [Tepidisphaeraceae bacterium]|nr:DUF4340 domain-containing protein [Tepidisphaeraceae bacterium]
FKTTLVLLIVVLAIGLVVLLVPQKSDQTTTEPAAEKLLSIAPSDVKKVAFDSDDGRIVLEKAGGKWTLVQPVKEPAEDSAVASLLEAITSMQSRGQIMADSTSGFDAARKVELTTNDDKAIKFDVGGRSGAGDNLYIHREGQPKADVVNAAVYEQLDKPLKQWRREKLFDTPGMEIKQVRIATTQGSYEIAQHGAEWQVNAGPATMPAEAIAVSDITMAIANLRAVEYVAENDADPRKYNLDQAPMTVSFSTQAPATQPSTAQPAFTTVKFGRFDDLLKKNVFAETSQSPSVVTVAVSSLEPFKKKPLDLRDRKVMSIEADQVSKITIVSEKAPTSQPSSPQTVVLERARIVMGPTKPATSPATTVAATQPATPPSRWNIASKDNSQAEDSKVDQLLSELHPLRAEKYMESAPATQPAATYVVTLETPNATHELRLTDPGGSQPLVGSYNGLTFEISRFLADRLTTDFTKGSTPTPSPMPTMPSPGFPMTPQ